MSLNILEIEQASIRITDIDGTKVQLQCLKEDVDKLPLKGISSGSSCFVLDALDTENNFYLFNKPRKQDGKWYPV